MGDHLRGAAGKKKEQTLELSTLFYLMGVAVCVRRRRFYTKMGAAFVIRVDRMGSWRSRGEETARCSTAGFRTLLVLLLQAALRGGRVAFKTVIRTKKRDGSHLDGPNNQW